MWREALCWLGLACAPEPFDVQPDVSAATILNLLVQTEARADRMAPAFGALYEDVNVTLESTHPASGLHSVIFRLGRGGQERATLRCDTASAAEQMEKSPSWSALLSGDMLAAATAPWADKQTRRSMCLFTYLDGAEKTKAFHQQAEIWAEHELGPLTADPAPGMPDQRSAHDTGKKTYIALTHGGLEQVSHAVIRLRMDVFSQ